MREYEMIGFQSPPFFLANFWEIISQRTLSQEIYLFTPLESFAARPDRSETSHGASSKDEDKNPFRGRTGLSPT
jgi:hypothetical protein